MVKKEKEYRSTPIPLRTTAVNETYIRKLNDERQYNNRNFTINKIIEEHRASFELYRLKAKARAQKLLDEAKKWMEDFGLKMADMDF